MSSSPHDPSSGVRRLRADCIDTLVGGIAFAVDESDALVRVDFLDELGFEAHCTRLEAEGVALEHAPRACARVRDQLLEYFERTRRTFDLELRPQGTSFQLRTWEALRTIPYGETISYGELASRMGDATAVRAVGQANNRNPIPVVIPCHRVIGADGALVGFGGGLSIKRMLLDLEQGQGILGP
jgi:O-6-methylguanine DNA methyltransferase